MNTSKQDSLNRHLWMWQTWDLALVQRKPCINCQKTNHSFEFQRDSMPWTFLLVPSRQNHHPFNPSHGWGRHPWRQSSHHIPRETLLLRLSCIPKELFWVWFLSHSCSQDEKHQNWKGYSKYVVPSLHMWSEKYLHVFMHCTKVESS